MCPANPGIIPESAPAEGDKESPMTSDDEEPSTQYIVLKQNRLPRPIPQAQPPIDESQGRRYPRRETAGRHTNQFHIPRSAMRHSMEVEYTCPGRETAV